MEKESSNGAALLAPNYQSAIAAASTHYSLLTAFVKRQMLVGTDYGTIPGCGSKPVLLKPGAEKICRLFQLRAHFELVQSVCDFDKPLFHYHYRCTLHRGAEAVGQGDGCCNTWEQKYKKQSYKAFDLCNTVAKIAQKRALVAAVLISVGASQFFTQDLEPPDQNMEE